MALTITRLTPEERLAFEERLADYNRNHPPVKAEPIAIDPALIESLQAGDFLTLTIPRAQIQRTRLALQKALETRDLIAYLYEDPLASPPPHHDGYYAYIVPRTDT